MARDMARQLAELQARLVAGMTMTVLCHPDEVQWTVETVQAALLPFPVEVLPSRYCPAGTVYLLGPERPG
jgi:hypothetical protein